MANSKITKWEYVTEPYEVTVYEPYKMVKRVLAPLSPSLSRTQTGNHLYLHLRPCVQGVDENGTVIKYLYCTRDGRFFVRRKKGWGEVKPSNMDKPRKNANCGGGFDSPSMRHFGHMYCHRCIAFAWCKPPQEVKEQEHGVHCTTKWEVDHLNCDHANWTADNLQWITADENRRRSGIARRLRKIGIDPKRLYTRLLKGIYRLPDDLIGTLTGMFLYLSQTEFGDVPLDTLTLNATLAAALDYCYERAHVKP